MMKLKFNTKFKFNPPKGEGDPDDTVKVFNAGDEVDAGPLLDGGRHIEVYFVDDNNIQRSSMLCLHTINENSEDVTIYDDNSTNMFWVFKGSEGRHKNINRRYKYKCSNCNKIITVDKEGETPETCVRCNCVATKTIHINQPV